MKGTDFFEVTAILPDAQDRLERLEHAIGLTFGNRTLGLCALIHRSAVLERERDGTPPLNIPSNERLEFLGDSIVGMVVAHYIYVRFQDYDEGALTEARSALARRSSLAILANYLDLGAVVYMGRSEQRGTRGYGTVLAEAFEAVMAAIFLDRGLQEVEHLLRTLLEEHAEELLARAAGLNAKSRLQEYAQAHVHAIPEYRFIRRSGPAHDSSFEVEVYLAGDRASGRGTSKRLAEQAAAHILLQHLGESRAIEEVQDLEISGMSGDAG